MKGRLINCAFCNNEFIKHYRAQKYCCLKCANTKNNIQRSHKVKLPTKFSNSLAEFLGILFGDGCVSNFYTKIYLNAVADRDYVTFVRELANRLFPGVNATVQHHKKECVTGIQISSKSVANYLKKIGFKKSRQIPIWINENRSFANSFIRGLFDTEGSVGFKKFNGKNGNYLYKQLTFTNRNKGLLNFVSKKLNEVGLKPTMNSEKNIYISNPRDIERFSAIIGSSNPKIIHKLLIKNYNGYIIKFGRGPQKILEGCAEW